METYRFCPPEIRSTQVPYQVIVQGAVECQHLLADEAWTDRILIQDGIVFVTYSCEYCGRVVCQSFDQVQPPAGSSSKLGGGQFAVMTPSLWCRR